MDIEMNRDEEIVARLKRLESSGTMAEPAFDYDAMLDRHATKQRRTRRRDALARGTASALVIAMIAASVWRVDHRPAVDAVSAAAPLHEISVPRSEPRIVRADTFLARAALEDHIAALDEALNVARSNSRSREVAQLERARAELLDSYTRVRYADMLSANL